MTIREVEEKVKEMRLNYVANYCLEHNLNYNKLDEHDALEVYNCLRIKEEIAERRKADD